MTTAAAARAVAVGVPAAFLGLFFVYPLGSILDRGLTQGGGFRFPGDVLFSHDTAPHRLVHDLAGDRVDGVHAPRRMPLAWATARVRFRGRRVVRALVVVPFVLPTVVVATAFLTLLPSGLDRGVVPILLAHVFFNVAVVVRVVGGYWSRLDPRLWDVAATLGASPAQRFRALTLPALRPAIAAAGSLTFLFCFTSFGVVVILGGPARPPSKRRSTTATSAFDLRAAAALSLLQLVAVAAIVAVSSRLEARAGLVGQLAAEQITLRRPTRVERVALAVLP